MIHEIAKNDRENNVPEYELAICRQLAPNPELGLPVWVSMGEVLWLEQVSEPDRAYTNRAPEGPKGHFKRLFACTLLLRNAGYVSLDGTHDGDFFIEVSARSVIQLVRSAIALGSQASQLAVRFLLWLHDKQSPPMLRPFVSFGVLLLQIQEGLTNLPEACAWVEEDEKLAREQLGRHVHSTRWLIGLNYQEDHSGPRSHWTGTFAQVIAAKSGQLPPEAAAVLKQMRDRLSG